MEQIKQTAEALIGETSKVIVGKNEQVRLMIAALLAEGHVLIDDMPGVGKTTLIKTLSRALGFEFKRIQFTPDLLPSDVIGMNIFDRNTGEFRFIKGPVHTNILLADEINRAIPRTQSALLESMEERQVTIDGIPTALPRPFFVLATQNPVESESTFKLPAAQMDRFMIRLSMGYPEHDEEAQILKNVANAIPYEEVRVVTDPEQFAQLQKKTTEVFASDAVQNYIVSLVQATRATENLKYGASPRASLALLRMSKAIAAMDGRDFITPDDVKLCAVPILSHRIVLHASARIAGKSESEIITNLLEQVEAAPTKEQIASEK